MRNLFKAIFLISLLLSGQATLATPTADASFIIQRGLDPVWQESFHRQLKEAFVTAYFKPVSGNGIEIANMDMFVDLIPDEDIAPFTARLISANVEIYLSIYTPDQLAMIASVLRSDIDATVEEIFSKKYQQEYAVALEQARTNAQLLGSDDSLVVELEEITKQIDALLAMAEDRGPEAMRHILKLGLTQVFAIVGFSRQIKLIEKEPDNPVTIAAIETNGVLNFANPVQRTTLLSQLSTSKNTGGIHFIRPPANSSELN